MKTTIKKLCNRTGVTLTELLVVLVIISVLSTIAVPVYTQHSERARRATAISEARELAMGLETVGVLHGFYVPLQLLDNVPGGTLAIDVQNTGSADAIGNEGSISLIDFNQTFFNLNINQPQLNDTATNLKVNRLVNEWQGPFMSFQRFYVSPSVGTTLDPNAERADFPLDPWGNPYRLFSPLGRTGSTGGETGRNLSTASFSDGVVTSSQDLFDRFAVLSYGPDGESAATTGIGNQLDANDDDVYYIFGPVHAERTESAFAPLPRANRNLSR